MRHKILLCFGLIFFLGVVSAALNVSLADHGVNVKLKSTGASLSSGNLTVLIYDAATSGNLVYNETFANKIINGSWNVMLGENSSNPLSLEFGIVYYKDYLINGEDLNFTNLTGDSIDRHFFYSPLGDIAGTFFKTNTNLTIGGNFSAGSGTLFVNNNTGRVGINNTFPNASLEIYSQDSGIRLIGNNSCKVLSSGCSGQKALLDLRNWNNDDLRLGNIITYTAGPLRRVTLLSDDPSNSFSFNPYNEIFIVQAPNVYASTKFGMIPSGQTVVISSFGLTSTMSHLQLLNEQTPSDIANIQQFIVNKFKLTNGTYITPIAFGMRLPNITAGNYSADFVIETSNATYPIRTEKFRVTGGGNVGINNTSPSYRLSVGNESNTDKTLVSAFFEGNITSAGYITRTEIYDKSKGSALDFIGDADSYFANGKLDDSRFYGYVTWNTTIVDYSKPVLQTEIVSECSLDVNDKEVCTNETVVSVIYPYTKILVNKGVSLDSQVSLLIQGVYELKVQNANLQTENNQMKTSLCKLGEIEWC